MKRYAYNNRCISKLRELGALKLVQSDVVASRASTIERLEKKHHIRDSIWVYWDERKVINNYKTKLDLDIGNFPDLDWYKEVEE